MTVFVNAPFWATPRATGVGHLALKLITAPTIEPFTLAEAKLHCRIDTDADNALVASWIRAARTKVERETGRALLTQTWDAFVEQLSGTITLPLAPLQSVTAIYSTDTAGAETVWLATNYIVDTASDPGRIALTTSGYWPTDIRWFQSGRIRFVAGWATPALIPADLLQAMALQIGWFSENRQPAAMEREVYDHLIGPSVQPVVA